jgi:exodeoxyribonuclease VIII
MSKKPTRIEFELPATDYRAAEGISKSELDDFAICPAFYNAKKRGLIERESTPAMQFGTLLHGLVLDGVADYHIKPDGMTFASKDGKAWRDQHQDKAIISQSEANELHHAAGAILKHRHAAPLFGIGDAEASLFGIHRESGLLIKGRADWLGSNHIVDIKTTADASNRGLSKSILSFRYHVQAAMYLELAKQNGREVDGFYFIAIERGEFPLINVRKLSQEAIELGKIVLDKQLRDLAECINSDTWPDYSGKTDKASEIDLPPFAYTDTTGFELIGAVETETETNEQDLIP